FNLEGGAGEVHHLRITRRIDLGNDEFAPLNEGRNGGKVPRHIGEVPLHDPVKETAGLTRRDLERVNKSELPRVGRGLQLRHLTSFFRTHHKNSVMSALARAEVDAETVVAGPQLQRRIT